MRFILKKGCAGLDNFSHLVTDFSQQTCIDKNKNDISYYYWTYDNNSMPYYMKYNKEGKKIRMY